MNSCLKTWPNSKLGKNKNKKIKQQTQDIIWDNTQIS